MGDTTEIPVRCPQPKCRALMVEVKSTTGTALVCSAPLDHPETEMHGGCFPLPAADRKDWLKRMARERTTIFIATLPSAQRMQELLRARGGIDRYFYRIEGHPGFWIRVPAKADGCLARYDGAQRRFARDIEVELEILMGLATPAGVRRDSGPIADGANPEPKAPDDAK